MINDIVSQVRLCRAEGDLRERFVITFQTPETQKPAFAGFCEIQDRDLEFELVPRRRLELPRPCGHQHLKLACLPISPSGQYRQRVCVVDGAHYTERLFNCKPLPSKKPGKFHQRHSNQLCGVDKGF
jgi:hypothetical protein